MRVLGLVRDFAVLGCPELAAYLQNETLLPVSWVLALFYRAFSDFKQVLRVWDYLFSSQPLAVFTFSAALIITLKPRLELVHI